MQDCIFCKIVKKELPKELKYEDDNVVAFDDINPAAEIHIVFVPKEHIDNFETLTNDNVLSSVRVGMQAIIRDKKLIGRGYKIIVNGGGAQVIEHLHFHLIGPVGLRV